MRLQICFIVITIFIGSIDSQNVRYKRQGIKAQEPITQQREPISAIRPQIRPRPRPRPQPQRPQVEDEQDYNVAGGDAGPEPPVYGGVMGTPGVDFPAYQQIPKTSFRCTGVPYEPGMYADEETQCQAYHVCFQGRKESFLCGVGTVFNQAILACDYWHSVDCASSSKYYSVNEELGKAGAEPGPGGVIPSVPRPIAPRPVAPRPVAPGPRPGAVVRPIIRPQPAPFIPGPGPGPAPFIPGPGPAPRPQPIRPVPQPQVPVPGPGDDGDDYGEVDIPAPAPVPRPRPQPVPRPGPAPGPRPVAPAPRPYVPRPGPAPVVPRPGPVPAPRPGPGPRPVAPAPRPRPSKTSPPRQPISVIRPIVRPPAPQVPITQIREAASDSAEYEESY